MINFKNILKELSYYENVNKEDLLKIRIEERLNKSLNEYYDSLNKTIINLCIYNENNKNLTLMKKINKGDI